MIYYMIRHKASGELMPQLRNKGYSHWNPSIASSKETFQRGKLTGCPRLFPSFKIARNVIAQWNALPNGRQSSYRTYDGEYDDIIDSKPDGRKKEDLEIVIVNIEETGVITS